MSPEQRCSPDHIDGRADMWALAKTARYAFTGGRDGELAGANVAVSDWFQRALHPDPSERFRTPREMALALVEAAVGVRDEIELQALWLAAAEQPAHVRPLDVTTPARSTWFSAHRWKLMLLAAWAAWAISRMLS